MAWKVWRGKEPPELDVDAVARALLLMPTAARLRAAKDGRLYKCLSLEEVLTEGEDMFVALL